MLRRISGVVVERDQNTWRHIVVEEHSELIDNLREGDIATAEEKLRAHLKAIERHLDKVGSHYSHYFEESE